MIKLQRSSVIFLCGLSLASVASLKTGAALQFIGQTADRAIDFKSEAKLSLAEKRAYSERYKMAVRRAWSYISANTQEDTGFVDSVAGFASTTLWDQGSYVFALVAAHQLSEVSDAEFDHRTNAFLTSLGRIPLFDGKLPNKAYDTRSLQMVNYQNEPTEIGIGWSALDVCRILLALRVLEKAEPRYGAKIRAILAQWDLNALAAQGELWGTALENGEVVYRQEGRLGYEQYAARAGALWGLDVSLASSAQRILEWVDIGGVDVPADKRDAAYFEAISPILSEPFLLQAFELGLDAEANILADRIYKAQEMRFETTGIPTMVSEDHIDQDPYFLYSSVYSDGQPWAVLTEDGTDYSSLRTVSTKAVFGWDAVYDTDYTQSLMAQIVPISDPEKGWPAGIYEVSKDINAAYTLNTNAVIIEAIHYAVYGPLWQI